MIYTGEKDSNFENSIKETNEEWGSSFNIEYSSNWKKIVKNFNGLKVHLTMYGERHIDKISELKKIKEDILIVVGGSKVPGELYEMADYNISIGNQPHSEVAALAVFLNDLLGSKTLYREFDNARLKVIPSDRGKKVVSV